MPSQETIALIYKDICNYIHCNIPEEPLDIDFYLKVADEIITYIRDECSQRPSSFRISNSLESTLTNLGALRLNLLNEKIEKGGALFEEKKT